MSYTNTRKLQGIDAKVIEHSVYQGQELITFVIRAPKFLDAEINRHRMFSQNSTSDRAIPFDRMKDAEFFIPRDIRKNQKGMQGFEQVCKDTTEKFKWDINELRNEVINTLALYPEVHKQHLNRYLLPWSYQTKIITTNNVWFNYFESLRDHPAADPAIQELAKKMREAYTWSQPKVLEHGEWHLPFITEEEKDRYSFDDLCKMSSARCARISYNNHDGTSNSFDKDNALFTMLFESKHLSVFEHQATPMETLFSHGYWEKGITHMTRDGKLHSGNFTGFVQYRQLLQGEEYSEKN